MLRARLASVLVLALTGACTESPSFSVRWKLHPHTDAELQGADIDPLLSVKQCTELGISRMRVTTRDANGTIVDEREFQCFPRGFEDTSAVAPGPEVGPGDYTVTVTALGRRGVQFCAEQPDDGATFDPDCDALASDAAEIKILETGEGQRHTDFLIVGVPQCRDGVDNDRDGYTDLADPSCAGDPEGVELSDAAAAQIIVRPRLMSGNPSATCFGLGFTDFELDIAGPSAGKRRFPCTTTAQTFTEDLDPGDYILSFTGLGAGDAVRAVAPIDPEISTFTLAPGGFRTVDMVADFTIASFNEPIEAGVEFSVAYVDEPGDLPRTTCTPGQGGLVLDQVAITVLDQDLQIIPTATFYNGDDPPIVLDGATTIPCEQLSALHYIEPLTWGDAAPAVQGLYLRVEAFPAGSTTACFGNPDDPAPASPNASLALALPRLSNQGDCAD